LKVVKASTEQIATNNLASIQTAATMRDMISDIRFAEARHVMLSVEREMEVQEARIAAGQKKLADLETTEAKVFDSPAEVEVLHAFKQHRDQWSAVWARLRTISRRGAAASEEAQKMYQSESETAFNLAIADALKLGELNATQSQLAWANAQETYSSTRILLIATITFAILLAALFGWFISRAIASPIGDAVRAAREIAAGDMTASIHPDGTDEISQLLHALDDMRQSLATVVASVRQGSDGVATASSEIAQGDQDL
jgi:methyl-accepting chemotaxis protein